MAPLLGLSSASRAAFRGVPSANNSAAARAHQPSRLSTPLLATATPWFPPLPAVGLHHLAQPAPSKPAQQHHTGLDMLAEAFQLSNSDSPISAADLFLSADSTPEAEASETAIAAAVVLASAFVAAAGVAEPAAAPLECSAAGLAAVVLPCAPQDATWVPAAAAAPQRSASAPALMIGALLADSLPPSSALPAAATAAAAAPAAPLLVPAVAALSASASASAYHMPIASPAASVSASVAVSVVSHSDRASSARGNEHDSVTIKHNTVVKTAAGAVVKVLDRMFSLFMTALRSDGTHESLNRACKTLAVGRKYLKDAQPNWELTFQPLNRSSGWSASNCETAPWGAAAQTDPNLFAFVAFKTLISGPLKAVDRTDLNVAGNSDINKMANAIISVMLDRGQAVMKAGGAGALFVAMSAVINARKRLKKREDPFDIMLVAEFITEDTKATLQRESKFLRFNILKCAINGPMEHTVRPVPIMSWA